ncbi:hypothetical protein RJ639_016340 [Escallonia herrerae]|uniref:Disease resistance N-terminal domain-containing protein n=1 Tax=Escallonia herrerae TaxID=1293975 RepID=A0AA89AIX9_9ASTE|nr:hypothetical protein RJ639_016340 [Escallonia herrerae]
MALVGVHLMIGKIVSILENEASLLGGVYDELDELKRERKGMRSGLEDADRKRVLTQGEKSWVEDVRDICNPVEDISSLKERNHGWKMLETHATLSKIS